jgi:hypothetical protein
MADDIKIKLGLDAAELFNGISKATADLNKLIVVADKTETEISQIGEQKVDVDTTQAVSNLEKLSDKTEETSQGFSGFAAGFGGGLAASGLSLLSDGIVSIAGKIKDGALAADEFGDTLEVAFSQQGIADVDGEIEKVRASTLNLANDLGLPTERTRELASTVATMGGVAGSQAEELTKLSAGLEVFSGGAVKGEAVALAFSKGLADPEGAAAIEKLAKKYPQLAETLRSNIDPAEKMKQANLLLGESFKTVADQQGDAGGSINKLQNQLGEAFQTIGAGVYDAIGPIISELLPILQEGIPKAMAFMINAFGAIQSALSTVFGVVQPVLTFMYENFDAISKIVGVAAIAFTAYSVVTSATTAVTAAYAAVQTALGGSISIATVAQYAWNLAMSLNPIGAVVAALAVLGAGIYAVTEALSVSAEETREQAEANVEMIKTQKDANEEQTKAVQSTKTMADEFLNLSKKKKLTADESKRLKELNGELNKEYPDLVKNTSNYKDNLDGVEAIANRAGTSLQGLAQESAKLDKALMQANQTLSFAKRNEAIEEALSTTKTGYGKLSVVTDEYGNAAVNAFAKALYAADTQEEATAAYSKATRELASNSKALQAVSTAYNSQIAALNAYKKTADTVVDTNKKLGDSTVKAKGDGKGGGTTGKTPEAKSELEQLKEDLKDEEDAIKSSNFFKLQEAIKAGEDEKVAKARIDAESKAKLREFLNTRLANVKDANAILNQEQVTSIIKPSTKKGETVQDVLSFYTDNIAKYNQGAGAEVKLKLGAENDKEIQDQLKNLVKRIQDQSKTLEGSLDNLIPASAVKTTEELKKVQDSYDSYANYVKGQALDIQAAIEVAIGLGDDKTQALLEQQLEANQNALNDAKTKLDKFAKDSAEEIEKNSGLSGVFLTFQTSLLDAFNLEKLMKERETNEKIREERLNALNAEEDDLTNSLAKREISFEEYAAKIADIDKARQDAMEETETTFMERMKGVMDQTVGNVLKGQATAINTYVSDQFKDTEGNVTETGKVIGNLMGNLATQFGELALSGKATLADFARSSVMVAYQALQQMIPIFIAEIAGKQFAELGLLGIAAAAGLTVVLNGLFALAAPSLGFKDGVVGLEGPGTERSDSIPAWLSKGESVITAAGTRANREELEWMNKNPGMSIRDYFTSHAPQVRYSVGEDGGLIREVQKLREETRGLGRQINRNTHVSISGELKADNNSIKAVIESERRRNARRG